MVVFVTVTNGVSIKAFKVETAAELIPSVRDVFGEGFIMDAEDVVLTSEYGNLQEGEYVWRSSGDENDPVLRLDYTTIHRCIGSHVFLSKPSFLFVFE